LTQRVIEVAKAWKRADLSHRGSSLGRVFVAESTVLRVLTPAEMALPGLAPPPPPSSAPWSDWSELVQGVIYIYDFTHFIGLKGCCAIAVVHAVSRHWLATDLAPEETWVQARQCVHRRLYRRRKRLAAGRHRVPRCARRR
jgi:hypothetical protein